MIQRTFKKKIQERLVKGKALIIFGPRQSGKSTLVEEVLRDVEHLYLNGDDADVREVLTNTTATKLKVMIGNHKIVYIDEAQRIPTIDIALNLFTNQIKAVQVIATGFNPFELSSQVNVPLTGRKYEFIL